MIYKPEHFDLQELVCPHVYKAYGELAWSFFDPRLLLTLDFLRERLNKPILVNNWHEGGKFDERGCRCLICETVRQAIEKDKMYFSAHMRCQAADFDVLGLVSEEVRQWILSNKLILPYPVRLEAGVSWVHLDTANNTDSKVILFNS